MSDEPAECPLCMEVLEIDDHSFFPCTCGYQICRFCWHRIRTDENGLCPACRKQYPEDPAEFKPLTEDELQNIKKERKQKDVQRKQKAAENRKHLANVRVVQRNLVFVVGLSPRLADPEVLKKYEYFGKFGKIHKVVINQSTSYAGSQGPSASAYVTYVKPEDALRAILTVNNVHVDGRTLKTSLGTTKYCSHFLKGSHCQKNDCMYLHELGEEAASFTKDEMQAGKHQEYEQMLIEQFLNSQNSTNNHHVISNSKLKKNISQQAVENTDVIPSLMDIPGDLKQPNPGPLLPNPVSGPISTNGITPGSSHSAWPLLERSGSPVSSASVNRDNNNKSDPSVINNSNRMQNGKNSHRSNTPPGSGGGSSNGNPIGSGRHKSSSTNNSQDENLIGSQASSVSSSNLSSSPPDHFDNIEPVQPPSLVQADVNTTNIPRGLPLPTPVSVPLAPASPRAGNSISNMPSPGVPPLTSTMNGLPQTQSLLSQEQSSEPVPNSLVNVIGSNRRTLLPDPNSPGLSFFTNNSNSSNLLNPNNSPVKPDPLTPQELPSLSLPPQEPLSDSLPPITSDTDWSAAFGFKRKDMLTETKDILDSKDLFMDDELGFDPCAESFKGLADLMEKESGLMQMLDGNRNSMAHQHNGLHSPQQHIGSLNDSSPTHSHFMHTTPQMSSSNPLQVTNTQTLPPPPPPMSRVPPGFSISHIQQQQQLHQQQQLFRPDLANSKMLDYLNFGPTSSHHRFNSLQNYHTGIAMDLHSQHQEHTQQHLAQRDSYHMKDMQEQLRSMLPNINISFGASLSHQQTQQPPHLSSSLHVPQPPPPTQSAALNKSWPLSTSPDSSPWNDPAIVSTSQLSDNDCAPHWLKSLQQLTETDGPSSSHHARLPFVQQFPMGASGWPPHTHNPPPGFRINGMQAPQNPESTHQLAEGWC